MKFLRFLDSYVSIFEREWFIGLIKLFGDIVFVLFAIFLLLVVIVKIIDFICWF